MATMMRRLSGAVLALCGTLALTGGVQAQADGDQWYPFLGCWEPSEGAGPVVCIRPTPDGIEMARIADDQIVSREALTTRPEGTRSDREGCTGEHHAAFSDDGQRVFLSTAYSCQGGGERSETGVLSLAASDLLLDVRSVAVEGGDDVAWVQFYRPASASIGQALGIADLPLPGMALETARRAASARLDIDDVVEAAAAVGAGATEAWVAETGDPFDLDADRLITLADRGVSPAVIDLMIAVSYPDRFALAVDDARSAERISGQWATPGVGAVQQSRCYSGYAYDPYVGAGYYGSSYYDPFYSGCGYRYSRYSYGPYGYSTGWYGYYTPVVYVGSTSTRSQPGRVVKGRGYTRGRGDSSTGSAPPPSTGAAATSGGSTSRPPTPPVRRAKPRGGGGGLF